MRVEHTIPKGQAKLLVNAQQQINEAQAQFNLVANTVLLGLEVEGKMVSVDPDTGLLVVEVPDPVELTDAA